MLKVKWLEDGYLMSQSKAGKLMGLDQRTVSKAELSMLKKLKAGLSKHGITELEFQTYLKYYME